MAGSTEFSLRNERWCNFLRDCNELAQQTSPIRVSGRLTRVAGLVMEATGLKAAVGSKRKKAKKPAARKVKKAKRVGAAKKKKNWLGF